MIAFLLACGSEPEPEFRPRTPEERAMDMAAGIDPDKPLPKWDLSAVEVTAPPAADCRVGRDRELRVGETVLDASKDPGEGPDTIAVPTGRHAGQRAWDAVALAGPGAVLTACDGAEYALPADAKPGRWLLVRSNSGPVKLLDVATDDKKPLLRGVTVVAPGPVRPSPP